MADTRDMPSPVPQRRALGILVALALLPIMFVSFVNYVIDPFQYFRVSNPPRFSNLMQRIQAPGIIRNYDFDTLVVGNSVVANLQGWMFDRKESAVKPSVMNVSLWGSTIREDTYVVRLALNTKPVKAVYWSIGRQGVLEDFRYPNFPKCMYGGGYAFVPPFCYLLNTGILWESYAPVVHSNDSGAGWVADIGQWKTVGPLKMDPHAEACQIQKAVKLGDLDSLTRSAAGDLSPASGVEASKYRDIVLPIVRSHRDVRFVFLFSPVHLSKFWQGAVNGSLRTERALIDLFLAEPNVEIYDMTGLTSITHDLDRYRDAYHYDAEGARQVAVALASGQLKINSIAEHEKMLRDEIGAGAQLIRAYFSERCP